jgi:hypothetical protein
VSAWVASTILLEEDLDKRAAIIAYWMQVVQVKQRGEERREGEERERKRVEEKGRDGDRDRETHREKHRDSDGGKES